MMQRVQLVFNKDLTLDLREVAEHKGTSISQLVRQYLVPAVKRDKKNLRMKVSGGIQALLDMAEKAEKLGLKGSINSSTNDDYIYR